MTTKYTPGPWKTHYGRGKNPRFHIQTTAGYQIASTTELSSHAQAAEENAERQANALLITAAPELAEALWEVVTQLEGGSDGLLEGSNDHSICQMARHALQKAGLVS